MADITGRDSGYVEESGKVNWRGDQAIAPQPQSIYKSSSVPFAELGARKVVGDRVFRYARAGAACTKAMLAQATTDDTYIALQIALTAGGNAITGAKALTLYASTNLAANFYAEGYVHVESGVGEGDMYRIKSHASVGSGSTGTFYLYDEIVTSFSALDLVTMTPNLYKGVLLNSGTGGRDIVGIPPISVTTDDYFWLQTWGPAPCKFSATPPTQGLAAVVGLTGAVQLGIAATDNFVGSTIYSATGGDTGLVFLRIAP